jgi:hypothetical protein
MRFQPWEPSKLNEFALELKGREADLIKPHQLLRQKLECAIETCYNATNLRVVSTFDLPPLQLQGEWFLSRRDRAIVAWHEVPGTSPPQESRPIGHGMILAGVHTSIQ